MHLVRVREKTVTKVYTDDMFVQPSEILQYSLKDYKIYTHTIHI